MRISGEGDIGTCVSANGVVNKGVEEFVLEASILSHKNHQSTKKGKGVISCFIPQVTKYAQTQSVSEYGLKENPELCTLDVSFNLLS